ncbi:olfactory receptor 10A4-like [Rhinatrema bivittatum]|uniref:olfactory receptor 10A4-like n=1 Tax=Rhinatrema bivittatum TaxID=194408 RepID=UPI00112EBF5A|nr:olfactory receptor 10A4-like [Rhinatrema bivittatum]
MGQTAGGNQTAFAEFILLGFSDLSLQLQCFLFSLFLIIYIITLWGNAMLITVVTLNSALHTPMYYFLRNLSFLEVCYISTTLPNMLANILMEDKSISFQGCAIQMYFFLFLGTTECFFLAVMAYDRYLAICDPLHYTTIMSQTKCIHLVAGSWLGGIVLSMGQTGFIFSLSYCGANEIDHFFCDIPPVLKLACADTFLNEITIFLVSVLILLLPFLLILFSYVQIVSSILRIRSAEGRQKAFSTCASHLISVSLFYGTGMFTYLRPKSSHSSNSDKVLALSYSVVTPMLNPFIYSLRNKDVKGALRQSIGRKLLTRM